MEIRFDFHADSLDNAMAWSRDEFAFFNGTNVFLYPEGASLAFPASVTIKTESDWRVATGMQAGKAPGTYQESNYHDLVDMPFFVGRFDYDSALVDGVQARLATYPAGVLQGRNRSAFWDDYRKLFAPQAAVFGEMPFKHYTTLIVFDSAFGGGSALEHQNSHVGIYTTAGIGQSWIASITAHEMIHAWNVKRLRPAEMFPYRYDVAAAHDLALGQRRDHRLLRRPGPAPGRHRRFGRTSWKRPSTRSGPSSSCRRWRWRMPRCPPGSTRPMAPGTSTTTRARWRGSCWTS